MTPSTEELQCEVEGLREQLAQARALLEQERAHFRSVFEGMGEGLIITDLYDRIEYVNARMSEMCGFSREEMIGHLAFEVLLPRDEWPELHWRNERRAQGFSDVYEALLQRKSGERVWVLVHATPLRDASGQVVGTIGAQTDITERKRAELALRQSEERLRSVVECAVDGFIVHDFEGRLLEVNAQICESLGWSREELLSMNVRDFEMRFMADEVKQKWESLRGGGRATVNGRQKRRDGSSFPVEVRVGGVEWNGQRALLALVRDVSDRERLERELRGAHRDRKLIMEAVPDVLFHLDLAGNLVAWNPELERVTRFSPTELQGKNALSFFEPPFHAPISDAISRSMRGEQVEIEAPLLNARGDTSPYSFSSVALRDEEGTLLGLVGSGRDMSERHRVEEQTRNSLREKEVLLKEVHHRVKNNLQIVNSLLSMQAETMGDARLKAAFTESQNRVRAMALIHETLYLAGDLGRVDVAAYVRRLTSALLRGYGESVPGVSLCLDVASGLFLSLDAAVPCGLIINELVTNSFKYAFPGGRGGTISLAIARGERNDWTICLRDDGIGMPDMDLKTVSSTGLQLVSGLCEQLEANCAVQLAGGTIWTISFISA